MVLRTVREVFSKSIRSPILKVMISSFLRCGECMYILSSMLTLNYSGLGLVFTIIVSLRAGFYLVIDMTLTVSFLAGFYLGRVSFNDLRVVVLPLAPEDFNLASFSFFSFSPAASALLFYAILRFSSSFRSFSLSSFFLCMDWMTYSSFSSYLSQSWWWLDSGSWQVQQAWLIMRSGSSLSRLLSVSYWFWRGGMAPDREARWLWFWWREWAGGRGWVWADLDLLIVLGWLVVDTTTPLFLFIPTIDNNYQVEQHLNHGGGEPTLNSKVKSSYY